MKKLASFRQLGSPALNLFAALVLGRFALPYTGASAVFVDELDTRQTDAPWDHSENWLRFAKSVTLTRLMTFCGSSLTTKP